MTKIHIRLFVVIAACGVVLVLFYTLFPWSKMWCRQFDVDIMTGKIRTTTYIFKCKCSEHVSDSPFTHVLDPNFVNTAEPKWKRVCTFPLFGPHVSPHYAFHGSIAQMNLCEAIWTEKKYLPEEKREMAKTVLKKWQTENRYSGADEYISAKMK